MAAFLRRWWIPVAIVTFGVIAEAVNWSVILYPMFGRATQFVLGRMILMLVAGLLLIWFLFTRRFAWKKKGLVLAGLGTFALAGVAAVREVEQTGDNSYIFHFRWEKTQDERLAEFNANTPPTATSTLDPAAPRYTDFLGPNRDGHVPGPTLATTWATGQPSELWRRPVGGGYASFVTAGGLAVTIEQRGNEEAVVAYDLRSGVERWQRSYPGHFKESMGGNGPRATPTIVDNDVIALGASGTLAVLDLATGAEKWHTNILQDAEAKNVDFGMCGAPLVMGERIYVHPGGKGNSLVAYDRATGKKGIGGGDQRAGYATPRLVTLVGQPTVLVFGQDAVAGHDPQSGAERWRFGFPTFNGINVSQPLVLPGDRVLITAGYDAGSVALQIKLDNNTWTATPVWQNKRLRSKMSSPILHGSHLYGLDDGILVCLDASTGERLWKGGRYGHGQLLLRGDVLVIQAENGDVVLVAADPKAHRELARRPMLPGGKTWNAPALAGNLLLIRNHQEAVCLELPVAQPTQ